jgi:hypothetical protein
MDCKPTFVQASVHRKAKHDQCSLPKKSSLKKGQGESNKNASFTTQKILASFVFS